MIVYSSFFHWIIYPFFIVLMTQSSMTRWLNSSMIQFFQQPLGLLQIFSVKPFGEPPVDLGQHCAGFSAAAGFVEQAGEARGRAKLVPLQLPLLRDAERLTKTLLAL